MKKSRIIVSLLLAFVIVFGIVALAACDNGGGDSDKPIELVLWAPSNAQSFYKTWADKWAADYKDSQGRTYKVKLAVMEEGDAKSNLLNAPEDGADVFLFADDQVADLANAGILADLGSGTIAQDVSARNSASSVTAASYQKATDDAAKLYAYPMQADNTYYLFYNDEFFTAEDVKTWDGIFDKLAQGNQGKEGTSRKKVQFDYGTGWYAASWFFTFGGTFTPTTSNFATAEVGLKALQAAHDFSSHEDIAFQSPDDAKAGLIDGSIVAAVAGSWIYSNPDEDTLTGVENNEHIKLTVLPKITFGGQQYQMKSFIGSKLIGVNAQAQGGQYILASHALANYLTSEEVQKAKGLTLGAGPSNTNAAADPQISALPTVQVVAAQSEFAVPQINLPVGFWDAVQNAVNAVKFGAENEASYFEADGTPIVGNADAGLTKLLNTLNTEMFATL